MIIITIFIIYINIIYEILPIFFWTIFIYGSETVRGEREGDVLGGKKFGGLDTSIVWT